MLYDTLYFIKDTIIVLLLFALIAALSKIRALKQVLEQERKKRSMPLLALEVETEPERGIHLINDSYCYARNIKLNDANVIVDYGFKKHLTLKFDPVDVLKPGARCRLNYKVFDDGYDITATDGLNIINHFSDAPVDIKLRYENMEGGPFSAHICSERDRYITKDVASLQTQ